MINAIIQWSIHNRFFSVLLTAIIIAGGIYFFKEHRLMLFQT